MLDKIILCLCLGLSSAAIAESIDSASKKTLKFEFKEHPGTSYTFEELNLIVDKNLKVIVSIFPELQGIYVDEKTGEIVLTVLKNETDSIRLQKVKCILGLPVKLMVISAPLLRQ